MELSADCHFRDCTHTGEPRCAVVAAVAEGALAAARLDQWLRLNADIASAERRTDPHAQRQFERRRVKEIYKPTMELKKRGR